MWEEIDAINAIRDAVSDLELGWEDASIITPRGGRIVLTTDHIGASAAYPGEDLRSVVRRGISEAMSDIAATGCNVIGIQIDVKAPNDFIYEDFFAIGLGVQDMLTYSDGILLQGSNLTRGEFGLSTTVVGCADENTAPLRRNGALIGDVIALSGPVGGWDGALTLLNNGINLDNFDYILDGFLNYKPELDFGRVLRGSGLVHSCIDCNDCLGKSLFDFAKASQAKIVANFDLIPFSYAAQKAAEILSISTFAITFTGISGDDKLLFSCSPNDVDILQQMTCDYTGRNFTVIGTVEEGHGAFVNVKERFIELPFKQPIVKYNCTHKSIWTRVLNDKYEGSGTILSPIRGEKRSSL